MTSIDPTPGRSTCEAVADLLGLPLARTVKSLVLATDRRSAQGDIVETTLWLLLVRGDHQLNEIKAGKLEGLKGGFRFATHAEIEAHFGCKPGYLGPIAPRRRVHVVADASVAVMADFGIRVEAAPALKLEAQKVIWSVKSGETLQPEATTTFFTDNL